MKTAPRNIHEHVSRWRQIILAKEERCKILLNCGEIGSSMITSFSYAQDMRDNTKREGREMMPTRWRMLAFIVHLCRHHHLLITFSSIDSPFKPLFLSVFFRKQTMRQDRAILLILDCLSELDHLSPSPFKLFIYFSLNAPASLHTHTHTQTLKLITLEGTRCSEKLLLLFVSLRSCMGRCIRYTG